MALNADSVRGCIPHGGSSMGLSCQQGGKIFLLAINSGSIGRLFQSVTDSGDLWQLPLSHTL